MSESFGNIIGGLSTSVKKTIRKYEHTNRKLIKAEFALRFNEQCLNENVLPTYTNIKTHDPAVREEAFTKNFRKELIFNQIKLKKDVINKLMEEKKELEDEFSQVSLPPDVREKILEHLATSEENSKHSNKVKIGKKLSKLYGGLLCTPENKDRFVNLSKVDLTDAQKEFLNLGLKCHFQSKNNVLDKKASLEMLYEDILKLEKEQKVTVNKALRERIIGESTKLRGSGKSQLLTKQLKEAAKQLRDNEDIVIRRADKASTFVILDKDTYIKQMNETLSDTTKFERLTVDPTDKLKAKANTVVKAANAVEGEIHFSKISGDYSPGYAYGNVKMHKKDKPLRPIISQVTTPTYKLAKRLNELLSPYVPAKYSLKSTEEFLDILRDRKLRGSLASLDVESLFTNVPVLETIDIILDIVYSGTILPPLKLSKNILKQLLLMCTTEAVFRGPDGKLYRQKDGIAMGSPLGPLFANFYMCNLENSVLENMESPPELYGRYVDDIFVCVRDETHLKVLKSALEDASVLKFTYEISESQISFLDVTIEKSGDGTCSTSVHRKLTDEGHCLSARSECPERYKLSVIRAFVKRAIKNSSSWQHVHGELSRSRQILVNNGYSNQIVDTEINRQLDALHQGGDKVEGTTEKIKLFYRSQMNTAYKTEERAIRDLILTNVKPTDENKRIDLIIYYNTSKTANLVMVNNMFKKQTKHKTNRHLQRTNVIYQFSCPEEGCRLLNRDKYIGATTTSLSKRLTMHKQQGALNNHMNKEHNRDITRNVLVENTKIMCSSNDQRRLWVLEALYIREHSPHINKQLYKSGCATLTLWS